MGEDAMLFFPLLVERVGNSEKEKPLSFVSFPARERGGEPADGLLVGEAGLT